MDQPAQVDAAAIASSTPRSERSLIAGIRQRDAQALGLLL